MKTCDIDVVYTLPEALRIPIYKTDHHWSYCNTAPREIQGWKIYISCSISTIDETLIAAGPVLAKYHVPFKYCNNQQSLEKLNAGMFGYSQIGKAIVVYAELCAVEIMTELKLALADLKGSSPALPFALQIGDDSPLFYRYGSYSKFTLDLSYGSVPDQRNSKESAIPDGITDIFRLIASPPITDPIADLFIPNYPIINAILQNGKSGTFLGLNIHSDDLEPIVLKIGYKNGAIQRSSLDGYEYVRHEIENYHMVRSLNLHTLCPRLVDSIDTGESSIVVTEFIDGYDMFTALRLGALTLKHLLLAWEIINKFHLNKCIMNDPKLSNFLIEHKTNRVLAIDLEMLQWPSTKNKQIKRSFRIDSSKGYTALDIDRLHFLASILLSLVTAIEQTTILVNAGYLMKAIEMGPDSEIKRWVHSQLASLIG